MDDWPLDVVIDWPVMPGDWPRNLRRAFIVLAPLTVPVWMVLFVAFIIPVMLMTTACLFAKAVARLWKAA